MRVSIVGDISFQDIPIDQFKISDSVQRLLGASSLNIGNLESVISSSLPPIANHPVHLRGPYSAVKLMTSFHLLSLANNHIQDYGSEGVEATELALNQAGLFFSGLGKDINEASNPFTTEIDGEKVAVFCVSRFCRAGHGIKGTPGDSSYNLFSQIRTLCKKGYFVIVFFHWGYEYIEWPSPRDRLLARKCILSGAGIVAGAHPHVRQRYEVIRGKPAIYSLGNFIFADSLSRRVSHADFSNETSKGFLLQIDIKKQKLVQCMLYPIVLNPASVDTSKVEEVIDVLDPNDTRFLLRVGWREYLRQYNSSMLTVKRQNEYIRHNFLSYSSRSLKGKIATYKAINWQDAYNRLVGELLNIL